VGSAVRGVLVGRGVKVGILVGLYEGITDGYGVGTNVGGDGAVGNGVVGSRVGFDGLLVGGLVGLLVGKRVTCGGYVGCLEGLNTGALVSYIVG
jgi:hypothetical protein